MSVATALQPDFRTAELSRWKPARPNLELAPGRIVSGSGSRLYMRHDVTVGEALRRRQALRATLHRGSEVLHGFRFSDGRKAVWWIGVGTALGFARERDFIEGDTDVDVRALLDYRDPDRARARADELLEAFRAGGFQLCRELYWETRPMQYAFFDTRNDNAVFDLYFFYSGIRPGRYLNFNWQGYREKPARFIWFRRRRRWPTDERIEVYVPFPIGQYNRWRWGPDWRIPKKNSELTERDLRCIRPLPPQ